MQNTSVLSPFFAVARKAVLLAIMPAGKLHTVCNLLMISLNRASDQWTPTKKLSLSFKYPILSKSVVLSRLHQFLNLIDMDGEVSVDLARTQSKLSVFMEVEILIIYSNKILLIILNKNFLKIMFDD